MATAAHELPSALRVAGIQVAALTVSRLAPFIVPTVALGAALYPRSLGFSSLPVLPAKPNGNDGFASLGPNDPVQVGIPPTEYTRPATERKHELPISATTEPELHGGGTSVRLQPLPGKALHVDKASNFIHLAQEAETDTAPAVTPSRAKLTFSDVVIATQTDPADLGVTEDKTLRLKFQAGEYGQGNISIGWLDPSYRGGIHVEIEKSAQLPDRLMGEILARALGHEIGFIPRHELQLRASDIETKQPVTEESALTIARWALGMHGHQLTMAQRPGNRSDPFILAVSPNFRTTSYYFEDPVVLSGHQGNGEGIAAPKVFLNLNPASETFAAPPARNAKNWVPVESPDAALNQRVNNAPKNYVIPIPSSEEEAIAPRIGVSQRGHPYLAQGGPVLDAGEYKPAYDPYATALKHRTQWLTDKSGHYAPYSINPKNTAERAFQEIGRDGDLRWFPTFGKPVSTAPFAGLMVRKKVSAQQHAAYEIRVPDARALDIDGSMEALNEKSRNFPDLASMVLEPSTDKPGWVRISNIKLTEGMEGFLPTFVGQALSAVQLDQPFKGLVVNAREWEDSPSLREGNFSDGLTIYGLDSPIIYSPDKQLGKFSPEVPFVLKRGLDSGDIELSMNPNVLLQR